MIEPTPFRAAALALLLFTTSATAAEPPTLAMLPIRMLDTSGEPADQAAAHAARLAALADALSARLAATRRYRIVGLTAPALASACPEETSACILAAAKARGGGLAFVGVVHKSSTLIMQMFVRVVDTGSGATLFSRELNFRGDTDEAWRRMEEFLFRQIEADPPTPGQ